MLVKETSVSTAGVYRCCLTFLRESIKKDEVGLFEKAACPCCGTDFTLLEVSDGYRWFPDELTANA